MPQLIYETTDTDFANRAIEALEEAAIPCYRIGSGYSDSAGYTPRGASERQVCIYIERNSDYAQSNQILMKLGAVVDRPLRLPPTWILVVFAAAVTALGFWVANSSK